MKSIVMAAGKGTRLQSEKFNLPKVLREADGKALIDHVLSNIPFIKKDDTVIIAGYMKEKVIEHLGEEYKFAIQEEQLGTGHAVMMAEEELRDYKGNVIVLSGDMPLISKTTYENIVTFHQENNCDCTVLTCVTEKKLPFGRIIKENDFVKNIVEEKDCTEEQKKIKELNAGVYVFDCEKLFENLKNIKNTNAQKEYYLTDVPKLMAEKGLRVMSFPIFDEIEITGVNTQEDLEYVENVLKNK